MVKCGPVSSLCESIFTIRFLCHMSFVGIRCSTKGLTVLEKVPRIGMFWTFSREDFLNFWNAFLRNLTQELLRYLLVTQRFSSPISCNRSLLILPENIFLAFSELFRVYQKRPVSWNGLMTVIKSFGALSERSYLFLFYSSTLIKIVLNDIFSVFVLLWIQSTTGVNSQLT